MNTSAASNTYSIVRLSDVKRATGLSRSTIYQRMAMGEFPRTISLGARAVGWLEADVQAWLHARVAASRAASE